MAILIALGTHINAQHAKKHIEENRAALAELGAKMDRCLERETHTGDDYSAEDTTPPTASAK